MRGGGVWLAYRAGLAVLWMGFSVGVAWGQTSIKVDVNLVNVAFAALDPQGKLVEDLKREDIEVLEDAVPQKVEFFAKSTDLPLTLALIVDVSGSQDPFGKKHKEDLQVFLQEILRPQDRVILVCFGNHLRLVSDYTNSAKQVLDNYREFDKAKGKFPEVGPQEGRELGTAFYDAIFYTVTEKLASADGRKAILMFSDGEDNSSSHNMMTAIETAQRFNVPVYAIRYTETNHGALTARNKYGISVMDRTAKETGGLHVNGQATDPHTYFREIAEELRTSYELAYYPTNRIKDGTFRKIVIHAKLPGIQVRTKTGYFSE